MLENIFKITLMFGFLLIVLGCLGYMFGGGSKVYVAILTPEDVPEHGVSGKTKVIGVFRKRETAESKVYQYFQTEHNRPSKVIECIINKEML